MKKNGFTVVLVIVVISFILVALSFVVSKNLVIAPPESTVEPTTSPTLTPTPIPSIIPSPIPTTTLKPTVAPKPTLAPVSGPPGSGLSTISVATEKGNFKATVLSLDLSNTKVITDTANDSDCGNGCAVSSLQAYIVKNGGFAGVNGTYFCPSTYPDCAGKTNSFDFPVFNTRVGHWINGGNLFWNSRSIMYFDGGGAHYMQNASSFSGGLTAGIVNYPGLIDGGSVQIDDGQSGLSANQKARGTKVGIGTRTSNNVMIVVAQNVNMQEFAYVFKSLGAVGALNLDTGGSTALVYGGRYVYGPGRDLPNAIIFASK